jgi:hypothetical protein
MKRLGLSPSGNESEEEIPLVKSDDYGGDRKDRRWFRMLGLGKVKDEDDI